MAQFTLRSSLRRNQNVILLHSGETSFDDEGVATVTLESEHQLKDMLNSYEDLTSDGFDFIPENVDENEIGKSAGAGNDIGTGTGDTGEDAIEDQLKSLSATELKQLAEDSGFEKSEWGSLPEDELKTYLSKQLQA